MDNQQGPTIYHRELSSVLADRHKGTAEAASIWTAMVFLKAQKTNIFC